ncbi:MAG: NAD(P)/FAD-dependent oxidoreductase [Candidatus Marsarchaeota archaeon]|nr:NAD(P)/FAD-dependent oxidoreductase [Candidatus Marsarchaeota archaeon]
MAETYDIIVAGAGLSGTLAAAAAARTGLNVLMVDKNKEEEVGKKTNWGWVCGDAVAVDHLNFVSKMIDISFDKPELDVKVDGVIAYSPDLESSFPFDGEGYVLDRPVFERKLRDYAIKSGVHYLPQFDIEGPVIEGNKVTGVFGKDKSMVHKEMKAKIVIDALGISTTLRRRLPDNQYVDRVVDIDDVESTGRFIYDFDVVNEDKKYYDPKIAIIHLNQIVSPGGYGWVFPKSQKGRANIGIGVQKSSLEVRNQKLGKKDNLHSLMDEYIKSNPSLKNPKLYTKDNNGKGYWSVAVRRQMECLVFDGYIGAGDSMAMPNPISAGGIGPALVAGVLAGKNAARAVHDGDTSMKNLWQYNLDFNEAYGYKTAGMEVFRTYLQSLNNEIINYGMKNFLSDQEAIDLCYGRIPDLSLSGKFKMVLKGAQNISAFSNLLYAVKKMKRLNEIYKNYPKTMAEFPRWKEEVNKEVEEAKERFKPNPI